MKRNRWKWLSLALLALAMTALAAGCGGNGDHDRSDDPTPSLEEKNFPSSLHGTRAGKESWYGDSQGFGSVVTTAYAELPCADCHSQAAWEDAGKTWTAANCLDCHTQAAGDAVADSTCLSCHSRQGVEISKLGLTDVHRAAGMGCMDCHTSGDVHGDGSSYDSMLAPGAIDARCANCHQPASLADLNAYHDATHMAAIDCSTCHMQTAVACYNCHFDNEAITDGSVLHAKFASATFGGPTGSGKEWRFLVNRVIDSEGNTRIFPGSMQSLMADATAKDAPGEDGQGVTFVAIGPYYSHSIQRNAITCQDCHASAALQQYVDEGQIEVVKWQAEGGVEVPAAEMGGAWRGPQGVIPVPPDYSQALKFDFVDLADPSAPLNAGGTSSSSRVLFKRGADKIHLLEKYVTPLTAEQISRLGWFATSLHGTRNGKETFYGDGLGEMPAPLQQGFGNYVDVPYGNLPCRDCHNGADNGPWDADGTAGVVNDTWPGNPVCTDCHSSPNPAADSAVAPEICKGCHSRLAAEAQIGITAQDVHAGLACSQCHPLTDMHGNGTEHASMFDAGAITADCRSCHDLATSATLEHQEHLGNIACSTCHLESVVTCYNCHFDNEAIIDGSVLHAKFASAKFGGTRASGKSWRFLVNRVLPGGGTMVYPASMQSLAADVTASNFPGEDNQGTTFVAIAPYFAHAVTRVDAIRCIDCHGTAAATALADGNPVDVVKWQAAAGEAVPAGSLGANWQAPVGVIPVPEDTALLRFDFVDLVDPLAPLNAGGTSSSDRVLFKQGADIVHMPEQYVRPLTAGQLGSLRFLHNTNLDCSLCHPRN